MKIIFIIVLFTTSNVYSQLLNKQKTDILINTMKQYVEGYSPGMAVGIVKNGSIIFEQYIGYSNLENKIKINENTRFNVASNAKQYTALCILKLSEEGSLNLNDDIRKYIPNIYKNIKEPITISQLLTHSSGIRDVYDLWALKGKTWWKLFIDNSDAIQLIQGQQSLNFTPGTSNVYSNTNFILLAEIIKAISKKKFNRYAIDLFNFLNMKNTSFLNNYMEIIPNKARAYGNWNGWKEYPFITETHGDGALFTTLKDQMQWEMILHRNNENYVSKKLIKRSQSRVTSSSYGYGLMFGQHKGLPYVYHNGNTGAYNATFLRFPTQLVSIIVVSNNSNIPTNYLAKQFANITLDLKTNNISYPVKPKVIQKLSAPLKVTGNYRTEEGYIYKVTEQGKNLYLNRYQYPTLKLVQEKGGLFQVEKNKEMKINFLIDKYGKYGFTYYRPSQKALKAIKVDENNLNENYQMSLNGKYFNRETNTEIIIEYVKDMTFDITKNGRKRKGSLIIKDYLRMNSYHIKVSRNKKGMINGLDIDNNRIKNVIFEKQNNISKTL